MGGSKNWIWNVRNWITLPVMQEGDIIMEGSVLLYIWLQFVTGKQYRLKLLKIKGIQENIQESHETCYIVGTNHVSKVKRQEAEIAEVLSY